MANLLSTLFSEKSDTFSYWDFWYGDEEEKKKIVGPLFGQLTFEAVPDTKKIIVISNIPEAYDVVEDLIHKLDRQEMAEVPKVVALNYADPEELSERLNAIFSEPGTLATIRLSTRGLTETGMEETGEDDSSSSNRDTTAQAEYKPWWGPGYRRPLDEMPISNVIGRIRFIPDTRSKAILVLAPPEFMAKIEEMIQDLDRPGKQVRIKAIVVEVDHSEVTSLGLQLASSGSSFGALEENVLTAFANLALLETYGSLQLTAGTDVTALVDFLVRTTNAKVLNQQTLWTKDNEEADFFKGQRVAFITSTSFSTEGGRESTSFDYPKVGMTLRVRPSITPQKNVDMNIDLTISQLSAERINLQPVRTYMNTTTTSIVRDGQTIMLGGILFQEDSIVERKVAVLGDLPLVGPLFRHNETVESNNELIIFITPQVIDEDAIVAEAINAEKKLHSMLSKLNPTFDPNE
jgi:type II secretory pathway component GspD/PulD (secretin)